MKRAILSTEDINSYGFWVKTEGIDLDRYRKNPVLLYAHNSYGRSIGRIINLAIENGQLTGEPEFDMNDPEAAKVADKYEKGFMKGFSIGIDIKELSDRPEDIKQGQRYYTVSRSELMEVSACSVPSNKNALMLSHGNKTIKLGEDDNNIVELLIPKLQDMNKIAILLGLAATAGEGDILQTIQALQSEAKTKDSEIASLKAKNQEYADKLKAVATAKLNELIDDPKRALTAEQKEAYRKLAAADFDATIKLLETQKIVPLHQVPNQQQNQPAEMSWDDMQRKCPAKLEAMKTENPEAFKELYKTKYNKYPKI